MRLKVLFYLFFLTSITVAQKTEEQKNIAEERVLVTFSSASVQNCFSLIEQQGYTLSYNPAIIDITAIRKITPGEKEIRTLLKEILPDYKLNIIQGEGMKIILQAEKKKKFDVSGVLCEKESAEKLYGGAVTFRNANNECTVIVSDNNGRFSVRLPEGEYEMEASYIGYNKFTQHLRLEKDLFLTTQMEPVSFEIQEITVAPRNGTNDLGEIAPSNMLSFNSTDIFAQVRILPGVIGASANGDLQVNGGSPDENLMLLDGIPVYHTNHMNSMLPAFNGDAVKSIAFHKSFFPTQFEGRLSSVTDIRLKDGNKNNHSQTLSIDMPAVSAMLDGPIVRNRLSYMISGRKSWLDFFDNMLSAENRLNHSFYDFNIKLAYDINERTNLQAIAYKANDIYFAPISENERNSILKWDNELYALKLNTVFGNKLFNTTTIAYTSYKNSAKSSEIGLDGPGFLTSGIREATFTSEFTYNVENVYRAIWGVKGAFERFNIAGFGRHEENHNQSVSQLSLFYDNRIRLTNKLFSQIGVNFIAYLPRYKRTYYSIQPRFSLKYCIGDRDLMYAGFSRMAQFYHYLRMDFFSLPTDFRMPSIGRYKPRTSNHFEIGWKHFLQKGLFEISAFYKERQNTVSLRPEAYPWDDNWAEYIMVGYGKSYGLKGYMHNEWKRFSWQLSYAYSRSFEWFPELQTKGRLPALTDVPHVFNAAISYRLTNHSSISTGGVIRSGRLIGNADDWEILSAEYFRKRRKPFNYRIDASYSYMRELKKPAAKLLLRVGLYNIIGNPSYEELIDFYTVVFHRHCLPYGSITIKF